MTGMKILIIIPDGLGDRPAPQLNGSTPLEAAYTPNLDRFARGAANGLFTVFGQGIPVGSPIAIHTMFGYELKEFPDRGVLIALSRGFEANYDDVVLSARFASVAPENNTIRLLDRFIRGEDETCKRLAESFEQYSVEDLTFHYRYWKEGDGTLFISGGGSSDITDSDPLGLDLPVIKVEPLDKTGEPKRAGKTAAALNRYLSWAHEQMSVHPLALERESKGLPPINFLITKWCGKRQKLEPFSKKFGLKAASLPDEEVVAGVVSEMGMNVINLPRIYDPEQDVRTRLAKAKEMLQDHDFIHLHTKEPDFTSHWNDPIKTKESIESWDRGFSIYWEHLAKDPNLLTIITSDHTTPSQWRDLSPGEFNDQHSGEPCPIMIRGRHVRVDEVAQCGERPAGTGSLGLVYGNQLMDLVLSLSDRTNLYGMRPTPSPHKYRPFKIEPFRLTTD